MLSPVRVLQSQGPMRVELARWRDRLVVVKRLQGVYPLLAERLAREAAVVRKLEHENIVALLESRDDALIYAYVPGVNLGEALRDGGLPAARAVKVARDVLAALGYAHHQGVIHLDVKPGNILIKGERALLTDFGFAKDLALTQITSQEMMLGTPNYMSPEQFQGVRTEPRSDIYGLGAVLYHMLTGEPPYGGQVIRFLVGDDRVTLDPLPPEAVGLAPIVHKALARLPEDRFDTAEEMLRALRAVEMAESA